MLLFSVESKRQDHFVAVRALCLVNCPFDNDYLPILQATVFAIHDCEYVARSVVEATKQHELRIDVRRRMDRSPRKLEAADDGAGTTQPLEYATRVK